MPAVAPGASEAIMLESRAGRGRLVRLDEAPVCLRDDPSLCGQIDAAVNAGSLIQIRVTVAMTSSGGMRANVDVKLPQHDRRHNTARPMPHRHGAIGGPLVATGPRVEKHPLLVQFVETISSTADAPTNPTKAH